VVLGGGLVGGFIARTLAVQDGAAVSLVDRDREALTAAAAAAPVAIRSGDLSQPGAVGKVVDDADVVVGALPGHLGYRALEQIIAAGKPVVDISFFGEDARALDEAARQRGVTAVVDCGVMPGLGGMLAAHLATRLDEALELRILVGGLPVERRWPLEYRAPFSPADVIEEYTRPARIRINGGLVTQPALSDVELIDLPQVGTLEAFNTDGLRSLLHTLAIPTMVEKTLRWPGHAAKMRLLRDLGLFGTEPLELDGTTIQPLKVTARLLDGVWRLRPGMREFTVMRVEVSGVRGGRHHWERCDLLDYTDEQSGDFSMARTTGWPAVLAALALASGRFAALQDHAGIRFPEQLAQDDELLGFIQDGLARAGIALSFSSRQADHS